MVSSIDDLIHFLLEQIALCSGLSYLQIEAKVKDFYSRSTSSNKAASLVPGAHNADTLIQEEPSQKVDGLFLEQVWRWLTEHAEVSVDSTQKISQVENDAASSGSSHTKTSDENASSKETSFASNDLDPDSQIRHKYDGLLLKTTDRKVWQAITGHDVDHSRVPKLHFDLLRHIAAAGEHGIVQPDLVRISHQDKRSVPKRTDTLHQKGYIVKSSVRRTSDHTSLCVLRKFTITDPTPTLDVDNPDTASNIASNYRSSSEILKSKRKFFSSVFPIIKDAGVITLKQLCGKLGIRTSHAEMEVADPWLYHMELIGCIERITPRPSSTNVHPSVASSLRFVRDITSQDWSEFLKLQHKSRAGPPRGKLADSPSTSSRNIIPSEENLPNGPGNKSSLEDPKNSSPIAWQPQRPFENQIYDLVENAGVHGISTIGIVNKLTGIFGYRTVESMLRNLSNVWQESQPPHLRHLALVRDTAMGEGNLHYRYWAYSNFQEGVKLGLLSWDAVDEAYESYLKERSGGARPSFTNYLDSWGFPRPSSSVSATDSMAEAKKAYMRAKEKGRKRKHDATDADSQNPPKRQKSHKNYQPPQISNKHKSTVRKNVAKPGNIRVPKVHIDFEQTVWNHATYLLNQQDNASANPPQASVATSHEDYSLHNDTSQSEQSEASDSPNSTSPVQDNARETQSHTSLKRLRSDQESDAPSKKQKTEPLFNPSWSFLDKSQRKTRLSFIKDLNETQNRALGKIYRELLMMKRPGLYIRPPQRLPKVVGRPKSNLMVVFKSDRLKSKDWFKDSSNADTYRLDTSTTFDIPQPIYEDVAQPSPDSSSLPSNVADENQSPVINTNDNALNTTNGERSADDYQPDQRSPTADANSSTCPTRGESLPVFNKEPLKRATKDVPKSKKKETASRALVLKDKAGVRLTTGSVSKQRADLILQIVRQAGGAYPGLIHLWYPYVTHLRKSDPDARPDHKTVERAIHALEKSGKLKHLRFVFETWDGTAERSIFCLPELDMTSENVQKVVAGIKEKYPLSYFPDGVRIDPSLNPYQQYSSNQRQTKRRRVDNADHSIAWENEDYDSECDTANDEQLSWQTQFQVSDYVHRKPPQGRGFYGKRLSKRISIGTIPVKEFSDDLETEDLESEYSSPNFTQSQSDSGSFKPFSQFIIAPETHAAAEQETLREKQARIEELHPKESVVARHIDRTSPLSWLVSWCRISTRSVVTNNIAPPIVHHHSLGGPRPRLALCTTLTDPDQFFQPVSGTFGTAFAVVRDIRPRLRLLTNVQRDYENKIPNTLQEIIHSQLSRSKGRKRKFDSLANFDHVVDAVQNWEKENEDLLASDKALMVPRFINHSIDQNGALSVPLLDDNWHSEIRQSKKQKVSHPNSQAGRRSSQKLTSTQPNMAEKLPNTISQEQLRLVAVTIIVIRTLVGGTDRIINKTILANLLPGQKWPQTKYQWEQARSLYPNYIEKLEGWFQDSFIQAYEKDEVPRLDYNDIESYDWKTVIDWVLKHADIPMDNVSEESNAQTSDPSSLHLDNNQTLKDVMNVQETGEFQEASLTDSLRLYVTHYRRETIANELPYTQLHQTLDNSTSNGQSIALNIAKTYVRANLLTPQSRYQPSIARNRLIPFGDKVLDAAVEELRKLKIIKQENKGRPMPGRNYAMGRNFTDGFKSTLPIEMYTTAVQYKQRLDKMFLQQGFVEYSPHTSNGQMLAILNLRAAGRLEVEAIVPPVTKDPSKSTLDPRTGDRFISIWGFTEGSYKTTGMDARNLNFPLRLIPTKSWIHGIPLPDPLPVVPAPHLSANVSLAQGNLKEKQIPLWFDIHDQFIPELWRLVVAAVGTVLALAPGASAMEVSKCCRNSLLEWEILLALNWMQKVGVVTNTVEEENRFVLLEWWWTVLGS